MCDAGSTNIATNSATTASTASVETFKPKDISHDRPTSPFPEIPDVTTLNTEEVIKTERDLRINRPVTPIRTASPFQIKNTESNLESSTLETIRYINKVETFENKNIEKHESVLKEEISERPISPFPTIPDVSQIKNEELLTKTEKDERICRSVSPFPSLTTTDLNKQQFESQTSSEISKHVDVKNVSLHNFNKIPAPFSVANDYSKPTYSNITKPTSITSSLQTQSNEIQNTLQSNITHGRSDSQLSQPIKFPSRPISPYPVYIPKSPVAFPEKNISNSASQLQSSLSYSQSENTEERKITSEMIEVKKDTGSQKTQKTQKQEIEEEIFEKTCTKAPEAVIGAKPIFGQSGINNELKKAFNLVTKQEQASVKTSKVKSQVSKLSSESKVSTVFKKEETKEEEKKVEEHLPSDFISKNLIFDIDNKDISLNLPKYESSVAEQNDFNHISENHIRSNAVDAKDEKPQELEIKEGTHVVEQQSVANNNIVVSENSAFVSVQPKMQDSFSTIQQVDELEQQMSSKIIMSETKVEKSILSSEISSNMSKVEVQENNNTDVEEYQTLPIQSLIKSFEQSAMPVMKYKQIREATNSNLTTNSSMAQFFSINNKENVSPVPDTATKHVETPKMNGNVKPDNLYYVSQTSVENRVFPSSTMETQSQQYMSEEKNSMFSETSSSQFMETTQETMSSKQFIESSSSSQISSQTKSNQYSSSSNSSSQAVNIQHLGGLQQSGKKGHYLFFIVF